MQSQAPSTTIADYDVVASGIAADTYSYDDISVSGLAHGTRQWYYRLKLTDTTSNQSKYIPEDSYAYLNDEIPNFRWSKIYRQKKCALEQRSGRDFILLKRRTWGERCEESWDEVLFQTKGDVCDHCDCWGTG